MDRDRGQTGRPAETAQTEETHVDGTTQAPHRLVRRSGDRMVAGVASGIADHFGWDPSIVRLAFLLSLLVGGAGLLAYLIAAVVIPEEGEVETPTWRQRLTHAPPWLLITGAALFAIGVASDTSWSHPGLWVTLILFGIGGMLLHESSPSDGRKGRRDRRASGPSGPVPTEVAAAGSMPPGAYTIPPAAHTSPREPSPLGLYTVGAALLSIAAAAGMDRLGWFDMDLGRYAALPLVVLGVGLVIGAFRGRGRSLIPLGLLLMPFVLVAGIIQQPLRGFIGERHYVPRGQVVDHRYEMLAGETQLDLTSAGGSQGANLDLQMALGRVTVFVPREWQVRLRAQLEAGSIKVAPDRGMSKDGTNLSIDRLLGPSDASNSVSLDIEAGIGEVRVVRVDTGTASQLQNAAGNPRKERSK
jgi:phage shock protein PspC (stress-responsive transcriptional regulator)